MLAESICSIYQDFQFYKYVLFYKAVMSSKKCELLSFKELRLVQGKYIRLWPDRKQ
jgi:hypothetical protein